MLLSAPRCPVGTCARARTRTLPSLFHPRLARIDPGATRKGRRWTWQQDTGQQDGYNEEDEAGDDFEDEDEEGEDGGEGDEDDEGSVLGEGQGEDIEDGREGKDDDQYEQAAPDPSDVAFLLN